MDEEEKNKEKEEDSEEKSEKPKKQVGVFIYHVVSCIDVSACSHCRLKNCWQRKRKSKLPKLR